MRKPKSPVSAWVVEQRKRHDPPWKSEELARRLGVAESTVRGWESGRAVSDDNLAAMERLFGVEAPGRPDQPGGDLAIVLRDLTVELGEWRRERALLAELQARVDDLQALVGQLAEERLNERAPEGSPSPSARPQSTGSGR